MIAYADEVFYKMLEMKEITSEDSKTGQRLK